MKKDEFVQEVINKEMGKFLEEEFPLNDYQRDRSRMTVTRFLIWLRNKYSGQKREIE
jgi:hypothetical protein